MNSLYKSVAYTHKRGLTRRSKLYDKKSKTKKNIMNIWNIFRKELTNLTWTKLIQIQYCNKNILVGIGHLFIENFTRLCHHSVYKTNQNKMQLTSIFTSLISGETCQSWARTNFWIIRSRTIEMWRVGGKRLRFDCGLMIKLVDHMN